MLSSLLFQPTSKFWSKKPFPYIVFENFLTESKFQEIQNEIINIPMDEFDRYSNPVEQKYTLRDKTKLPYHTQTLFEYLENEEFLSVIYQITGVKVETDPFKHYWGIHLFHEGDKLDIHVDAGIHPSCGKRKFLTFGLYLTKNYQKEFEGQLELWAGDNSTASPIAFIDKQVISVPCFGNTAIIFACSDNAWHGAPTNYKGTRDTQRIFLTVSYLIDEATSINKQMLDELETKHGVTYKNKKTRAYFPSIRGLDESEELKKFRLDRASEKATELYRQKV